MARGEILNLGKRFFKQPFDERILGPEGPWSPAGLTPGSRLQLVPHGAAETPIESMHTWGTDFGTTAATRK